MEVTMKCHKAAKGFGQGEALVSKDPILFYSVDPRTGIMREKHHQLEGSSVAGKVLVFPSGKASSSVQIDGLVKLLLNNVAPRAMIVRNLEATLVASAVLTRIPLVHKLEKDPFEVIRTDDFVKVDADSGTVSVRRA